MFGAIAGGIASALAGGAMSKFFGGGQKAASGGIQGDVLATDNNTVGMGDAGIKSAIQGSNVPNPDEAVPSFVSGAMVIGRMVLAAEGRKANDSHADCYQYFCVPEYGSANGRLHFHAVHFMRTLP